MTQKDHSLDRKALKRPDEFVKRGRAFFENFTENSTLVLVLCGVLVVLAIVIGAIDHFHFKSEMEARTALYQAKTQIQAEVRDSLTESDREDSKETKKKDRSANRSALSQTWPQQLSELPESKQAEALSRLRAIAAEHSDTRSSYEALVALGQVYLELDQGDKAVEVFLKAKDQAPGALESAIASNLLGSTYENLGQWESAKRAYQEGLGVSSTVMESTLMAGFARVHEALKDWDRAREIYTEIKKKFPKTLYAEQAEVALVQLNEISGSQNQVQEKNQGNAQKQR